VVWITLEKTWNLESLLKELECTIVDLNQNEYNNECAEILSRNGSEMENNILQQSGQHHHQPITDSFQDVNNGNSTALKNSGIVSLKEAWSMMSKNGSSNVNGGNNNQNNNYGHILGNGTLSSINDRLKLTLPLLDHQQQCGNNRSQTLNKALIKHQDQQLRIDWAEQNLSDEYICAY